MLRIVEYLAFMIGLISLLMSDNIYSLVFLTAGATLLFSPQPSLATISFAVFCFCTIYLFRNGFVCMGGFHRGLDSRGLNSQRVVPMEFHPEMEVIAVTDEIQQQNTLITRTAASYADVSSLCKTLCFFEVMQ